MIIPFCTSIQLQLTSNYILNGELKAIGLDSLKWRAFTGWTLLDPFVNLLSSLSTFIVPNSSSISSDDYSYFYFCLCLTISLLTLYNCP